MILYICRYNKTTIMKILFIYNNFPGLGGIESVTLLLANYFIRKDIDVTIISAYAHPDYDNSKISPLIKLLYTPEHNQLNTKTNLAFIIELINKSSFDFIINQGSVCNITKDMLPEKSMLLNTLHGLPFWEMKRVAYAYSKEDVKEATFGNKLPILKRLIFNKLIPNRKYKKIYKSYKKTIENSDCYILLCEKFKDEMAQIFPEYSDKLQSIENPIAQITIPEILCKKNEAIFVGRLDESDKRASRVLKIWSNIEKRGTTWELKIIGDGPNRERLLKLADTLKLKQCKFEGYQANPLQFQENAKITLLTSNFEGVPLSILESIQVGTVPVCYNCSAGIELLIDNNINGILISCFDEEKFSNELYRLMNNEAELTKLSRNAIMKSAEFSSDKIGSKWINLFNDLKSGR